MRTPPAITLPEGGTPAERLDMAFRKVLTVPKEALLREEAKEKRQRGQLKGERPPSLSRPLKRNRGPISLGKPAGLRKPGR
jgi:hypothetical protein